MKKTLVIILSIIGILLIITIGFFIYIKINFLNKNEIKDIIIKDTKLNVEEIFFDSIDLELENNKYEVEFYYNNIKYEYQIDAKNGRIIFNDFKINEHNNDQQIQNQNNNELTQEDAKNIALKDANINKDNAVFTEVKKDYDNNRLVYDIEFIYEDFEYNYEIDAKTGEITSYDKDYLR